MTDPAIDGAAEPSLSQSHLTTGRRLAAARESLGLSVADVARQIKLSVHQVEALEADDLARLPKSPVIVKGFLRNYAKLVQLDPNQLLGNLHGMPGGGDEAPAKYRRREVVTFERPSRPWLKAILGVLLIVAILLGVYEYQMNPDLFSEPDKLGTGERAAVTGGSPPSQPAAGPPPQASDAQPPPAVTVEGPETPAAPSSVVEAAAVTPASAVADVNSPPTAAAASGQGIVRFRFERDAWIEIKDRDGNRIMNELGKAGTEKSAQGIPPLRLVVGAASGVKVEWNDQPVNIVPFTKVDVARFTLE
jgi:cytoskeleton protein RodZ